MMMTDFVFHRPPLAHQRRDFERFKDCPYFALWWEPRVGKTKTTLDIFRYHYERNNVNALIVIAYPNNVHRVWIDELPKELPPEFLACTCFVAWSSGKTTVGERRKEALALRGHDGPIVFTLNCEALLTEPCWRYLEWLIAKRRVMLVADESAWCKSWSARTQKLLALGRRSNVVVKAILDGTPVEEGAIEIYHPTQFLKHGLLGYDTKMAFRSRYFEYEEDEDGRPLRKERHEKGGSGRVISTYQVFKGYRHLDELHVRMMEFGSRVRRADVSDAPSKVYQTRYFELTEKQRRVYDDLRDRYIAELDGTEVRAADVLLRMTRLQMVARNYYPPERTAEPCSACHNHPWDAGDGCESCGGLGVLVGTTGLRRIDGKCNPAIDALMEELRVSRGRSVVWCRFRQDVEDVVAALRSAGRSPLRYDGSVPAGEREAAYHAYRAGEGTDIVATILSGLSYGHDLTGADMIIYYSNEFRRRARTQSEDRAEGLGRRISTQVIDFAAVDTRDVDVIDALREKRSIAEAIMGDAPMRWL
jgi:Mesyanzhinovviridae DNA helicase